MILLLASLSALAASPVGPTCAGPLEPGLDAPRPRLSGPVQTLSAAEGRVLLHYTKEGEDAVDDDLLAWTQDEVARVLDHVRDSPWRELVGDDGTGGDDSIDAYFVEISANGFANAVTPAEGASGASCFVRFDPGIESYGENVARSIVRHELMHCAQYRYTWESHAWLYEASATYEQYRPAPEVGSLALLTNVLWSQRITAPDRPLDDVGDRFEYAGFGWFKYLEEGEDTPPWQVWEALASADSWQAGLATATGHELGHDFLRYTAWNQATCGREDRTSWGGFAQDNAACTAVAEAPREDWDGGVLEVEALPGWTSRTLVFERPAGTDPAFVPTVSCSVEAGSLGIVLDSAEDGVVASPPSVAGPDGLIDASLQVPPTEPVLLIVGATGDEGTWGRCNVQWAAPAEAEGGGCACSSAAWAPGLPPVLLLGLLLLRRRRR